MSTNLVVNGVSYAYPATGDQNWGAAASAWASAVTSGMLQKSGGSFTLTADAVFGPNFGLQSKYFTSASVSPSGTGVVRLANLDGINWRNAANSADISLAVNASNALQFNGASLLAAGLGSIVNADINSAAAIAYSKLNLAGAIQNSDLAGAISIAKGGTGQVTANAAFNALSPMTTGGDIIYGGASGAATRLANGSSGQALISGGGTAAPAWGPVVSNPMTTLGDLLYGGASGAVTRLAGDTSNTRKFLRELSVTGTAAAPVWDILLAADVPTLNQNTTGTSSNITGIAALLNGGTGTAAASANAAFNALSPLTTKGDLQTFSTVNARQAVGTDNQALIADSSQATGIRWMTLQQGAKNYITYNNFENAATTGWSLGTVGTLTNAIPTGSPTFGSGASGNLSITTVSSGQLAGANSLSMVSSAATTVGNMLATQAYAIDAEDQAKVLTFKFYYSAFSGAANCNFSGTSSNSFGIAIWDVTNSSWLSSTANFGMTQGTGIGYVTGTCQTNATTASLRFVIYNANATSGATTMYFDDFYLGPQTAPIGPVVTDWTSFTPTGAFTTNVTYTGFWRRVGGNLEALVQLAFSGATNAATNATINLPSGLTIDTTKLTNTATFQNNLGLGALVIGGTNYAIQATYNNATSITVAYNNGTGTSQESQWGTTAPATIANATQATINFRVPIVSWASNVQMSNDTDARVVAMQVSGAVTATITGSNSLVKFTSAPTQDTHGGYSTSTGLYTVPVTGYYRATFQPIITATYAAASQSQAAIFQNGSQISQSIQVAGSASVTALYPITTVTTFAKAGDTLSPAAGCNGTGTIAISTNATTTYFSVERLSGPAVIAATESVSALYAGAPPTGTLNASLNNITFGTKVKDTHNAYSAGTYTIPVSGSYSITGTTDQAATYAAGNSALISIHVNGTRSYENDVVAYGTAGHLFPLVHVGSVPLNAGDLVTLKSANSGGTPSFGSNAYTNYFSIVRTGN